MKKRFILAAALLATPFTHAKTPCDSPEYRQFDFWLGQWQVTTPSGKVAGENRISQLHGLCVVHEQYKTAGNYQGSSYNTYNVRTQQWQQTWVDNTGLLLNLTGGLDGKNMVLSGPGKGKDGVDTIERITWVPKDDGTVQQLWQQSTDNGKSWTTLFDGLYKKLPNSD